MAAHLASHSAGIPPRFRIGSAPHGRRIAILFRASACNDYGLQWIHGESPLAHPLDDGTAVMLERDLADQDRELGADAKSWRSLVQPLVEHWEHFTQDSRTDSSASPVIQF